MNWVTGDQHGVGWDAEGEIPEMQRGCWGGEPEERRWELLFQVWFATPPALESASQQRSAGSQHLGGEQDPHRADPCCLPVSSGSCHCKMGLWTFHRSKTSCAKYHWPDATGAGWEPQAGPLLGWTLLERSPSSLQPPSKPHHATPPCPFPNRTVTWEHLSLRQRRYL